MRARTSLQSTCFLCSLPIQLVQAQRKICAGDKMRSTREIPATQIADTREIPSIVEFESRNVLLGYRVEKRLMLFTLCRTFARPWITEANARFTAACPNLRPPCSCGLDPKAALVGDLA